MKENNLEDLIEEIENRMGEMEENLSKSVNNASAARRARKNSSDLEKLFKQFRKDSVAHHKKD